MCYSIIIFASIFVGIAKCVHQSCGSFRGPNTVRDSSFNHSYGNIYNLLCMSNHANEVALGHTHTIINGPRKRNRECNQRKGKYFGKLSANFSDSGSNLRACCLVLLLHTISYHCHTHPFRAVNSCPLFLQIDYHLFICTKESHFGLLFLFLCFIFFS